ncbi:uncharacterized protein MELLADRAFT_103374 [Melampsora larici-populina 98AG31]|uniref:Uncharacterized protein n=1 Tax=Melampsora larici-populina (strain 98AG31 / pathotype 3-4-7) TaxID=747676 RepID=F4RB94_MELLP|nr:uncharacterized protein MELLADRAFT_103374 [Melampsora larici-populina 98AG31]EGG10398.1 hypothetical protein MELLADRAFT_103374 [Melampsora larici-populina 98AG31]
MVGSLNKPYLSNLTSFVAKMTILYTLLAYYNTAPSRSDSGPLIRYPTPDQKQTEKLSLNLVKMSLYTGRSLPYSHQLDNWLSQRMKNLKKSPTLPRAHGFVAALVPQCQREVWRMGKHNL